MCDYHRHVPLPLQLFFDGVEALIASNTRPDEVGYRVDYNKAVLRECIQKYPGKEVTEDGLHARVSSHTVTELLLYIQ